MLEFPAECRNERVFAAQTSRRRRRALINELGAYAYRFPRNTLRNLDEDVPGDFFLFCHDKLGLMIDHFEDRGIPFEHYVNSVLKWQLRSFLSRRKQLDTEWQTGLYSQTWGRSVQFGCQQLPYLPAVASARVWVPEPRRPRTGARAPTRTPTRTPTAALRIADPGAAPGAAYHAHTARPARPARPARRHRARRFRLPKQPMRRRMLYALLKTAHLLDDRQFDVLVAATGCHPDSLSQMFKRLYRFRKATLMRRKMLVERRNLAFADLHLWTAVACLEPEPNARAKALMQAERHRATLYLSQRQIARIRLAPSNRHIAKVLGVAKGTVDSSLNWLLHNNAARYLGRDGEGRDGEGRDGIGPGEQQSA